MDYPPDETGAPHPPHGAVPLPKKKKTKKKKKDKENTAGHAPTTSVPSASSSAATTTTTTAIPWPDLPEDELVEAATTTTKASPANHDRQQDPEDPKEEKEEDDNGRGHDRAPLSSSSLSFSSSSSSSSSSSLWSAGRSGGSSDQSESFEQQQQDMIKKKKKAETKEKQQEAEEEDQALEQDEADERNKAKKKKKKKKAKGKEKRRVKSENATKGSSIGSGLGGEGSGSWVILGQLGSKPRKEEFGDDKDARRQYRAAKKEWGERKRTLIDSLSPDEVREYKKEKKELTEKERLERKRERQERRRLVKEKKKLYKKPKIGKLVTQETKSYELVCDMLLGIRVTVSKVSARPLHGNAVKDTDFRRVNNLRFPSTGSTNGVIPTPAHSQRDFTFRDYAPVVFRRLREHFGIEADDYLISLTGDYILSELISPGQSGQFFYFSYDLRFMLKTITRGEAKFLKAILPRYYNHIIQNPNTLIARFFGFHRVAPHRDRKHYFVVMGNIFAQNLELHYRFDLKGSTVGRVTSPEKIKNDPNVVMKDQDFDRLRKTIALGPEKRKLFIEQVVKDVTLLDELGIMDYSLLVGIHDRRRLQKGRSLSMVYLPKAIDDEQLATAKGFNADTESDTSESESDEEKLEQHHVTVFTQDQGGIQSTDEENQPTDYIYFIGIIDILQPFNLRKRAEHGLKSFRFDGNQISAVNPRLYANRFKDYIFARVKQPETPQTPREIIGLPPRPPDSDGEQRSDQSDSDEDREQQDSAASAVEQMTKGSQDRKASNEATTKGTKETSTQSDGGDRQMDVAEKTKPSKARKKQMEPGEARVKEQKTTTLGPDNAPPSQAVYSKETERDGSPRVGNAGLVPKQLKVEKKKQKMAAKKKHKGSSTALLSVDSPPQAIQQG